MAIECSLCLQKAAGFFPANLDLFALDRRRSLLIEKVSAACAHVFCNHCMKRIASTFLLKCPICSKQFSCMNHADNRLDAIFERSLSSIVNSSTVSDLAHLIDTRDYYSLNKAQESHPLVSYYLKGLFYVFLNAGKVDLAYDVATAIKNSKIKADSLVELANYLVSKNSFPFARKMLQMAFEESNMIKNKEQKRCSLINIGYEWALLTEKLIGMGRIDEVEVNIEMINSVISKVGYPIDKNVFFGRMDLYLLLRIPVFRKNKGYIVANKMVNLIQDSTVREKAKKLLR